MGIIAVLLYSQGHIGHDFSIPFWVVLACQAAMDWSQHSIPAMRPEPRFGDRIVPAFCERPKTISAMVAEAVARNPDGEAVVCGARRMT